jgi:membrane-bound PQQ-dependent dehydrogenase (glucose/quinate/shikimate family)
MQKARDESGESRPAESAQVTRSMRAFGALLALIGVALSVGGTRLVLLDGPRYYLASGIGATVCGAMLVFGVLGGATLYLILTLAACLWAFIEVRVDGWALLPRTGLALVLLLFVGLQWPRPQQVRRWTAIGFAVLGLGILAFLLFEQEGTRAGAGISSTVLPESDASSRSDDWIAYGRTSAATRFEPAIQITPANVAQLRVAWTYRSGDLPSGGTIQESEATPLKIDRTLYLCTPHNELIAVDAGNGRELWRYDPHVNRKTLALAVCRGVSYHRMTEAAGGAACAERIFEGTLDFRLIAVDARTGRPCAGFGRDGEVDLREGMGPLAPNFVMVTSPPTVANGLVVLGHLVMDNQRTDSPAGVVRAYDARTGELRWAWDAARETAEVSGSVRPYTLDTPNAWGVFAADPSLDLVYVPTGGAPPDYYGGKRTASDEHFGSAIVALDLATGKVRWSFQTVHHDLWDYDVGAQPTLAELPTTEGRIPALIQATKTGEIFVLDRRDGHPLAEVQERAAPNGAAPGDHTAATQPFSVGMPSVGGSDLTEKDIWGITPVDQMLCSLEFHTSSYRGRYTPPSVKPFIVLPGFAGGVDWGGVAVDSARDILIVNSIRLANRDHLVPRSEVDRLGIRSLGDPGVFMPSVYPAAQIGTPFGVVALPWLSPLQLPCHGPPWGMLTAIDLRTRNVLWKHPLGTIHDSGPLGIRSHVLAPAGVPNQGGTVLTGGGLTFIAATLDAYIRAFDTATGQELWRDRLPAGGQANPMSYMLDGRQYVVIQAGGHGVLRTRPGDYLIAYALPVGTHP